MSTIFVTKKEVSKARCSLCRSYLSVGPIWIRSNYQPVCRRCKISSDDAKYRVHFYENLAKYILFPCKNDTYGCDLKLPWGSVESHEQSCRYAPLNCPAFNCTEEIVGDNILPHFNNKHPELILHGCKFRIPCKADDENANVNKLFLFQNKHYVIQIGYWEKVCYLNLVCINGESNLFYDITIYADKSSEELKVRKIAIQPYENKIHDYPTMKKLDYSVLSKLLSDDDVYCKFTIKNNNFLTTDPLNENLLSDLECPICFQYMKSPIYMCDIGHSICQNCKEKVSTCPSCRAKLNTLRNYSLERIAEHVSYPCKFRQNDCKFYGRISELTIHEQSCFKSVSNDPTYPCFLNSYTNCPWVGTIEAFASHIVDCHSGSSLPIGRPITLLLSLPAETVSFAVYDDEVFRICLGHGYKVGFKMEIENVSKIKKHEYKFHIRIAKSDDLLTLTKDCNGNTFNFNTLLIKPFVDKNKLTFIIDLVKKL